MDQNENWQGGRTRPRRHCVRWGPSSRLKGAQPPPNFRPMSTVAKRLDGSRCHLVRGRTRPRPHCVRWGPSSPPSERGRAPPPFGRRLLWPNGRPSQLLLSYSNILSRQLHYRSLGPVEVNRDMAYNYFLWLKYVLGCSVQETYGLPVITVFIITAQKFLAIRVVPYAKMTFITSRNT